MISKRYQKKEQVDMFVLQGGKEENEKHQRKTGVEPGPSECRG
jgi:hypothetical protein